MQGLESPHICGSDRDHSPRVSNPILNPLLGLNPVNYPVGPHDLGRVRVGPGADEDAVAAHDDSAVGGGEGEVWGGVEG